MNVAGVIVDASDNVSLSYVNIGVLHKQLGAVSGENGAFSLGIPSQYMDDTLTFSLVGYEELNVPVKSIDPMQKIYALKMKPVRLKEIAVATKRLTEKKYGLYKYHPLLHFTDGSTNQNDIFEIAELMRLGATTKKVTSISLYINEAKSDSATFRINFYSYDGRRPGSRLVEKNITQRHEIKEGWLCFDTRPYSLYLAGDVIVAVEFIPSRGKNNAIAYEVKPGGRVKSFVRSSSNGIWQVPPHQYRMFVTALGTGDDAANALEEKDITPAFRTFSHFVNDSFSIFVRLPKGYDAHSDKTYPVIYLLDANLYFSYLNDSLDKVKGDQPILIGIGYKNFMDMDSLRNRDYTYPAAEAADSLPQSGGADKFYTFIGDELKPLVNRLYRTEMSNATLMGHSLGGYFTLYALYSDLSEGRRLFTNFVAASPSLDYQHEYLFKQFKAFKGKMDASERSVVITWGTLEDVDYDITSFTSVANDLIGELSQERYSAIKLTSFTYPGAAHMETAVPTFYYGLKYAYSFGK